MTLPHRIGDLENSKLLVKLLLSLPHRIGDLETDEHDCAMCHNLPHRIGDLENQQRIRTQALSSSSPHR